MFSVLRERPLPQYWRIEVRAPFVLTLPVPSKKTNLLTTMYTERQEPPPCPHLQCCNRLGTSWKKVRLFRSTAPPLDQRTSTLKMGGRGLPLACLPMLKFDFFDRTGPPHEKVHDMKAKEGAMEREKGVHVKKKDRSFCASVYMYMCACVNVYMCERVYVCVYVRMRICV